ncbi:hypothetical protein FACS1894208_01240 [Clostridia bacterium]|nr:hypothetical protein FACS1894208_01240 [Clostridia bacterium]
MARLTTDGLSGIFEGLDSLARFPSSVIDDMLNEQADILVTEQNKTGRSMGVHRTGVTLESIKKGKVKRYSDGNSVIYVTPEGENKDGNRNAEVAFVNEYGKIGRPPRPFIRTANENAAPKMTEAAQRILDDYVSSKNL